MKPGSHRIFMGLIAVGALSLQACADPAVYSPLRRTEPAMDSVQTRAPRVLRLYFDALPDVERSFLMLTGPAGQYPLQGLHTMAADDLMIEILNRLGSGDYTVLWQTAVGDDPTVYRGTFNFSVRTD